ncbi:hypothetical protein CPC16_007068 [Podila verticillata]|nr:hypothetical protein CPC16_007068 [Podila verticillata]KFH66941.1 hypothetical protein MVEG_07465 [Podila verticillata NRRL 6337]
MFSTTLSPVLMPDMMAHASSADAPFDSEVSFADLDSEALVTTLSATPLPTFMTSTPTQTATSTSTPNCDPSIIAISPLNLKLESPLLTALSESEPSSTSSSSSRRKSTSTGPSLKKRPAADPLDKEAKARERVLRNRAAAQESRDKKRKYMAEIEASNESLQQENVQLLKRLKTVESDNVTLSHKLEALSAQFAQMQQQLSLAGMMNLNNNSGVGFCQSAVLAKKAKASKDVSTNSRQQKLAPPKRSPFNNPLKNNHRRQHSMTMKNLKVKAKSLNREAPDQSAARWTETSCRPFCNNSNKALTLSSFVAASFQLNQLAMVLLLASILPQLMLNFSTLFLISTGAQSSSHPTEDPLLHQAVSFIHRFSPPPSSPLFNQATPLLQSGTIKDSITSLDPAVIEEIVTEFRQGRKDAARRLLVKALLSKS